MFFRNFTLSAQWGRLNANGGVLRAADGATLSVPVTGPLEGTTLQGEGWSATLNSGWVGAAGGTTWLLCYRSRELTGSTLLCYGRRRRGADSRELTNATWLRLNVSALRSRSVVKTDPLKHHLDP